jgi:WD40 repeat protein
MVVSPLVLNARAQEAKAPAESKPADSKPESSSAVPKPAEPVANVPASSNVSFMKQVAPILVRNCIACHNARKSESKYTMTTFAQLAKGGANGEGITLEPGKPEESYLVELIAEDAEPRMPYKQDPLPAADRKLIETWVAEGAKYDGNDPAEDWPALLHKLQPVTVPEAYRVPVPITALGFSPDGAEIMAAGYHEITAWKSADGALGHRLPGLAERIYDIATSPDGKYFATASGDPGQYGIAKLWIAEPGGGGKAVRDLVESSDAIFAVAFSPDSQKVATAGADRAIRVFEVATGKLLVTIEDHADWILDIAFSPDGTRLASASRDKTAKVFDVVKKESLVTFPGHAQSVNAVVFGPDGKSVYSAGADNQIRIWNPDDEAKQSKAIGGFGGEVFRLQLSPDGKTLAAAGADKMARLIKVENGSVTHTLKGHNDWIYSLAIDPKGATLASGSYDGEVRLWTIADGKEARTILAAPGYQPPASTAAKK